jgi:type IV pilus assembly protein PilP
MGMGDRKNAREHRRLIRDVIVAFVCVLWAGNGDAQAGQPLVQGQINPMRQDSIKLSTVPEVQRAPAPTTAAEAEGHTPPALSQLPVPDVGPVTGYDPSGRRDPFAPVLQELQVDKNDPNLPPLQRVALSELNLIAIVWGAYGYTAMVQTPEGHGYTVRRGTRIGQNNGVVSAITERGIIVQERFTDVYGKKQEREHVKLLHPKEGSE